MTIAKFLVPAALLGTVLLPLAAHADSVNDRRHDQRQRIEQGVDSGQLTKREQYRLDGREARLHAQVDRDRSRHGGHLTPSERRHLERDYNHTSRAIYRQKHDSQTR